MLGGRYDPHTHTHKYSINSAYTATGTVMSCNYVMFIHFSFICIIRYLPFLITGRYTRAVSFHRFYLNFVTEEVDNPER